MLIDISKDRRLVHNARLQDQSWWEPKIRCIFYFLQVKLMTLIKGEENVSFVSDRECDQRLEELKTGMSKAFDYNLGNDEIRKAVLPKCNVSSV